MTGPIVLLTDFGLRDAYVGVMKGVILRITPAATIVDLGHEVPPQDVAAGAYLLGTSYRYFAPDAIFVAVVDPGVGSARRAIALKTPRGTFLAPDNGLLTPILGDAGIDLPAEGGLATLPATGEVVGVELTSRRYFLDPVSATFHGRDVFAPAAAHLSRGAPLDDLGPPLQLLRVLPAPRPRRAGGRLVGQVVHVDRFGNLIADLTTADLASFAAPVVEVAGRQIAGLCHHYAERNGLLALIGSADRLEIAVNGGNAAEALGLRAGDRVVVREEGS